MASGAGSETFGGAWSARVIVTFDQAAAFERVFENFAGVISIYEWDDSQRPVLWAVEGLFDAAPSRAELTARVALAAGALGIAAPDLALAKVPAKDWLTETISHFPPLRAGRYFVHGDHVKGPFPSGAVRLTVNAATAFGSGQHASTRGCLLALDSIFRRKFGFGGRAFAGLDLGCGTGILGMAAAKTLRRPVLCADIDPEAVRVTRYNAARNGLKSMIAAVMSDGCGDRAVARHGPYGFITANILARPLVHMAHDIGARLAPGGWLIVAGFVRRDEAMVANAYRRQGLRVISRVRIAPWTTLILRR